MKKQNDTAGHEQAVGEIVSSGRTIGEHEVGTGKAVTAGDAPQIPGSVFLTINPETHQSSITLENKTGEEGFNDFLLDQLCEIIPGERLPSQTFFQYEVPNIDDLRPREDEDIRTHLIEKFFPTLLKQLDGLPVRVEYLDNAVYRFQHDIPLMSQELTRLRPDYLEECRKMRDSAPDLNEKLDAAFGRKVHPEGVKYLYATFDERMQPHDIVSGTGTDADYMRYLLDAAGKVIPGSPLPDVEFARMPYYPERGMIGRIMRQTDSPERSPELAALLTRSFRTNTAVIRLNTLVYDLKNGLNPLQQKDGFYFSQEEQRRDRDRFEREAPDLSREIARARETLPDENTPKARHVPSVEHNPKQGQKL